MKMKTVILPLLIVGNIRIVANNNNVSSNQDELRVLTTSWSNKKSGGSLKELTAEAGTSNSRRNISFSLSELSDNSFKRLVEKTTSKFEKYTKPDDSLDVGKPRKKCKVEEKVTPILDLSRQYIARKKLRFLKIYWSGNKKSLLGWIKSSGLVVTARECSNRSLESESSISNASVQWDRQDGLTHRNALHLILCDSAAEILEAFLAAEATSQSQRPKEENFPHWMILDHGRRDDLLSREFYIPLSTTVIMLRRSSSTSYTLEALWTPARGIPLRSVAVGHFKGVGDCHNIGQLSMADQHHLSYKKDLTDVHFRVTTLQRDRGSGFVFDETRQRFVLTGMTGEIFEIMKEIMNFTYSAIIPKDGQYGLRLRDGSWTGLVGDLVSGRADIAVALLSRTKARDDVISYSSSYFNFRYRIFALSPKSSSQYRWEAYLRSFDAQLWILILLAYLTLSGAFALALHLSSVPNVGKMKDVDGNTLVASEEVNLKSRGFMSQKSFECDFDGRALSIDADVNNETDTDSKVLFNGSRNEERHRTEWSPFFLTLSAFMQQGYPCTPRGAALRVLFLVNYLLGLLLLTSYSAMLVSFLTVADSSLPFTSLQSLADHGRYRLGILPGSTTDELLQVSYMPLYNRLVKPHADTLHDDFKVIKNRALKDPFYAFLAPFEMDGFTSQGACVLTDSKTDIMLSSASLAYSYGLHSTALFNYNINKLREAGLLNKLFNKYYSPVICSGDDKVSLGFNQVFTAFLALGGGAAAAVVVMLLERLSKRVRRSSR